MSGNSSGERVAFDIGGFVLKITETGTEPRFFYHQRTETGTGTAQNSRRKAFARNVDFSFIVSGSERTFTFRVSLNTLPTLATLV